jgi:hypothetical protein
MKTLTNLHGLIVVVLCLSGGVAHAGAVFSWPGSGGCSGTLQACIDTAPAGAAIDLVPTVAIAENLSFSKSLTLRGRGAARAQFADGRRITVNSTGSADLVLRLQDLGFENGRVQVNHGSSGRAQVELSGLRMRANRGSEHSGIIVDLGSGASAVVHEVLIENNDVEVVAPTLFDAGIELRVFGSGRRALFDVRHNRVRAGAAGEGIGLEFDVAGGADVDVVAYANEIQGAFSRALRVSEGRFSSTASTLRADVVSNALAGGGNFRGGGLDVVTNNGTIELEAINNTIVFGNGLVITRWGGTGGTPTGQVIGGIFG